MTQDKNVKNLLFLLDNEIELQGSSYINIPYKKIDKMLSCDSVDDFLKYLGYFKRKGYFKIKSVKQSNSKTLFLTDNNELCSFDDPRIYNTSPNNTLATITTTYIPYFPLENDIFNLECDKKKIMRSINYAEKIRKDIDNKEARNIKEPVENLTFEEILRKNNYGAEIRKMQDHRHQEKLQRENFKQQRILNSKEDKRVHALNTIIEHIEPRYPKQKNINIDYYHFNYESRMDASKLFEHFLKQIKKEGCIKDYSRSNYSGGTRFGFIGVDINKLKEFKRKLEEEIKENKDNKNIINKTVKFESQFAPIFDGKAVSMPSVEKINEVTEKNNTNREKKIIDNNNNKPFTLVKKNSGYFKFYKKGKDIFISGKDTRHFRLLQCLSSPFGIAKTIESVFDSIKLPKDEKDTDLAGYDTYNKKNRQVTLIKYAIKELQKGNKFKGKIKFEFDGSKNKVWIVLLS